MCVPRSARAGEDRIVDPTPKLYLVLREGRIGDRKQKYNQIEENRTHKYARFSTIIL